MVVSEQLPVGAEKGAYIFYADQAEEAVPRTAESWDWNGNPLLSTAAIFVKDSKNRYFRMLFFFSPFSHRRIGVEGVRPPAGLAGQVRPRRRSRGGSTPAPRSRAPGAEIHYRLYCLIDSIIDIFYVYFF